MPGWSTQGGGRDRGKLRVRRQGIPGPVQVIVSGSFGSLYLSEEEANELHVNLGSVLEEKD